MVDLIPIQNIRGPAGPPGEDGLDGRAFTFYSPKDYGAVVGGGVSALAAVQQAYDEAHADGGGIVIIDDRYGIDGVLNIRGGVTTLQTGSPQIEVPAEPEMGFVAMNAAAKVMYGQGGAGGSTNDNPGPVFNLFVDGADVGGAGDALFVCDAANSTLFNLSVRRSAGVGVDIGSSQNLVFYNAQIGESYTGDGIALLLKSRSLGRQGPGGNKFYGGHIGDSKIPIKVTANGPEDFFPPHDNIFEGVLFETGRVADKPVTCTGIFEAGETVLRSCVATIGANATTIAHDTNYLIDNPIFTGYSTVVVFDSCYFGAGAGTVKATDHIRVLQSGAFNEVRLYGRTQAANGSNFLCVDGVKLGAGTDVLGSIDGELFFVTNPTTYTHFRGINSGSWAGMYLQRVTPHRYVIDTGVGHPYQSRRKGDSFNRFQIDRDGFMRWLDSSSGATVGGFQNLSNAFVAVTGVFGVAQGYVRAYTPHVISADTTITVDPKLENGKLLSFTANGADVTSITLPAGYDGQELRFILSGTGTNVVTWPASIQFRTTAPQPINGAVTFLDLMCIGGTWREMNRSG